MKSVCLVCGAQFVEGQGWIEPHYFPCANDRYGWLFVREVPDDYVRPNAPTSESLPGFILSLLDLPIPGLLRLPREQDEQHAAEGEVEGIVDEEVPGEE